MLEKGPVMSKTHDHQLESSLSPVEVFTKTSASLEMHQGVSEERIHLGSSPKKWENYDLSHEERFHLRSPQEQFASYQDRRQSWRRASMKETNRRKSLHPIHQGITGGVLGTQDSEVPAQIRDSEVPAQIRGSEFSVQKLEPFLRDTKGFSLESFRAKASSLSEELKHFADRLEIDGTLQKCFEDSNGKASDISLEASVAEMKEYITKFSLECQTWDKLLQHYQQEAEEILSRGSTEAKITEVKVEPMTYLGSSQNEVLNTKPDYQKILQNQSKVFDCMELVVDELQGSVKQLQAFMDESTQCFQKGREACNN
ncbi:MIND complex subunit dsn1 [Saguinus oedipus]|uniref:MIND complex subunit dsn1 n=1 Tax=Saguinus oedipus TaxID=9490 RepID=A0ABQ9VL89_SAGOE|nr:MIND complex subunit dsn1 [Saguinus oedipus]